MRHLAVVGLGLIGGSLARALRTGDAVQRVSGYDTDPEQCATALRLGVIDRIADSSLAAVEGADMVVVAVPVLASGAVVAELVPALASGAVITDVGSTKGSVIAAVRTALGELPARFVPGHPIAGTEKSGVAASLDTLFRGRRVILTPYPGMDADAGDRVEAMWRAAGAVVERMAAEHHDEVLAATSHLPHVLAYALVDMLARMDDQREVFTYAAGGFRDFTRIASSSPRMWLDIVRANREALLPLIDGYVNALEELRAAIEADEQTHILETFSRARHAREEYLHCLEKSSVTTR